MRKTIFRLLLLAVAAAVMAGCVLIGRGYQMYQAALTQQSIESKVEELQSDPGYTGLAELPEMYLNAVVAVEDHRFEQHFGINLTAIGRAAWNDLIIWSLREGGSTIFWGWLFNRKSCFGGAAAEICGQTDGKVRLYYRRSGTDNYKINGVIYKSNGFGRTIKAVAFIWALAG